MQVEIAKDRPPYVTFHQVPVEDRDKSIELGVYTVRNVNYAFITPAGSKDRVEIEAEKWLANMAEEAKNNRFPMDWLSAYKRQYKDWIEGNDTPLQGTPIKLWGGVSPAVRDNLIAMNVRTVEDLAVANEQVMTRLGMGARTLKQQALDYLAAASGPGKLSAEMQQMRVNLDNLTAMNEKLMEANRVLMLQVGPIGTAPAAPEQEQEQPVIAGGLIDATEVPQPQRKL